MCFSSLQFWRCFVCFRIYFLLLLLYIIEFYCSTVDKKKNVWGELKTKAKHCEASVVRLWSHFLYTLERFQKLIEIRSTSNRPYIPFGFLYLFGFIFYFNRMCVKRVARPIRYSRSLTYKSPKCKKKHHKTTICVCYWCWYFSCHSGLLLITQWTRI